MSFDPNDKDPWSNPFGNKNKQPNPSIFDMFGSEKREFEPIDDDEDEALSGQDSAKSVSEVASENPPEPAPQTGRTSVPPVSASTASRSSSPPRQPAKVMASAEDESPRSKHPETEQTKMSHWDKLASALGLPWNKSKSEPAEAVESDAAEAEAPVAEAPVTEPPARERPASRAPSRSRTSVELVNREPEVIPENEPVSEWVADAEDDSLAEDDVEDVVATAGDDLENDSIDYIEFEVEELDPRGSRNPRRDARRRPPRDAGGDDRRPRRPRREPPVREEPVAEIVPESDIEPEVPEIEAEQEIEEVKPRPERERSSRGGRRRRRGRRGGAAPVENVAPAVEDELDDEVAAELIPDSEEPVDTDLVAAEADDEPAEDRPRRSRSRRGRSRRNAESRGGEATANDKRPAQADSRRARDEDEDEDEDDDFIELDSRDTPDKKQITTWNEAISIIVSKNISAHESKPRGRSRGRSQDRRRR